MSQTPLPPEFHKAYQIFLRLKKAHQTKQIDTTAFINQVDKLLVQDPQKGSWRLDENGQWYWFDGQQWIPRNPGKIQSGTSQKIPQDRANTTQPWVKVAIPLMVIFLCICIMIALVGGVYLQKRTDFLGLSLPKNTQTVGEDNPVIPQATSNPTLSEVSSITQQVVLSDQQQLIVDEFGWPDAFTIMEIDDVNGKRVRLETWIYSQGLTSFTFADGIFTIDGEVERFPQGTIISPYNPSQFSLGASKDQIQAILMNLPLDAIENSESIQEGVQLYACEQLMLGFLDDHLFYVDALAFVPEGGE